MVVRWRSRPNRPLTLTLTSTVAAAAIGNSFISKEDLAWLQTRRRPRMQISTSAFAVVGIVYYVIMGVVIYRASDRRDSTTTRVALVVLVLNEVWNVAFFGRRSTRNGFVGIVLFLIPLVRLQLSVRRDCTSAVVLAPYTAWVLCYDLPWTLRLWQLNRAKVG
jgi:tryptophan-rich sensory protein